MIQQEIEAAYSSVMTSYNRGLVPRSEDIKLLLDLTKLHLQVMKSGVPKKKEILQYKGSEIDLVTTALIGQSQGYNQAIDDFTAYLAQKLEGIEKIIKTIPSVYWPELLFKIRKHLGE